MGKNKDKKNAKAKGGKHLPPKVTKAPKPSKKAKASKVVEPVLDGAAQAKAVIDDPTSSKKAVKAAERFLAEAAETAHGVDTPPSAKVPAPSDDSAVSDAKLKAKVAAKKLLRKLGPGITADDIDRTNHPLVTAWNLIHGVETGSFITSTDELDKAAAKVAADVRDDDPTIPDLGAKPTKKGKAKKAAESPAEPSAPAQVAEAVETENGREFAVGAPAEGHSDIVAPTGAPDEVERDHYGRPYVEYIDDKGATKRKAYTRVTTYIDCLEDTTQLDKWKMRILLEGAGLDLDEYRTDGERDLADSLVGQAREIAKTYDTELAKIDKQQAKGKLDLGQFGLRRAEAKKVHDHALNTLAQTALDLGGVHERATKGTDLHALTEHYDRSGLSIDKFIEANANHIGAVSEADLRAYAAKMTELGIEHVAIEQLVVVDQLGIAGTLDRASLFKFPGSGRRVRTVADIKTGRVDYSAGKIGMQLYAYACGEAYDHTKPTVADRRTPLKLSKTQALLIHLPQGEARCDVYVVDIALAATGTRLAREVREWRNTGKKVYNLSEPLEAGAV